MDKTSIIIVQKNGDIKQSDVIQFNIDCLYKKCGYKKEDGFNQQSTWKCNINGTMTEILLYGKITGRTGNENKYEFPPPVDNVLFFGNCAIIAKVGDVYSSLTKDLWKVVYETLYGGFENLKDSELDDENEDDELLEIDDSLKTKEGYLKDGFVVSDDEFLNYDSELTEDTYD